MLIAIDAGHGYVKGLAARGQRTRFPALIAPAPQTLDLGPFGQLPTVQIDTERFVVGEAARRWARPLWTRDKAADTDTARLLLIAAAELGASGPVQLATGLPLAWFGAQHGALRDALRGFGGVVTRADGLRTRLWFEAVLVLPQGVAAAGPVLGDSAYAPGPYLVVDIGYRTTDYILVTKTAAGGLDFDPATAGSLDLGMHAVDQAVADALSAAHQTPLTAAQVAEANTVVIRGRTVAIAADRQFQARRVARTLVQTLLERLDHQLEHVLGLVAVGGGSTLLADVLPGVIPVAEPQWANVRGYLAALTAAAPRLAAEGR